MITKLQIDSPVGPLTLLGEGDALVGLQMEAQDLSPASAAAVAAATEKSSAILKTAVKQLQEYFAGKRRSFDLALAPDGTLFQRTVWSALAKIPYGRTMTYGELARAIGHPTASRAVGAANGANPIGIVIPCHRVIGANGKLTGYAGGVPKKRWLLDWEKGPSLV